MRVAALFSGGKDSTYAVYWAMNQGWDVVVLVVMVPENPESYMFHYPNVKWARKIGEAIGVPVVERVTAGRKEEELDDLKQVLKGLEIDGVVSGAVGSEYQKTGVEKVCEELGLHSFAPLWHKEHLLGDIVAAGFDVRIIGVYAEGLDKSWLGKKIDENVVEELEKTNVSTVGEGGEFETLVLDGPLFTKKLVVDETATAWSRDTGVLNVTKAHLE